MIKLFLRIRRYPFDLLQKNSIYKFMKDTVSFLLYKMQKILKLNIL